VWPPGHPRRRAGVNFEHSRAREPADDLRLTQKSACTRGPQCWRGQSTRMSRP
jgi:hypothetical protein